MDGDGVNRRTVLAGLAAAGFGMVTCACSASAETITAPGTRLWRCVTPAGGVSTLVVADSVVCAGIVTVYPDFSSEASIYAIDAATGKKAWASGDVIPLAAGPGVVFCIAHASLAALSAANGKVLWHLGLDALGGTIIPLITLYEAGAVYLAVEEGVIAFSGQTGKRLWLARTPGPPTALAVAAGTIYTGWQANRAGELAALDAATGTRRWTVPVSTIPGDLAVTDGVVVSCTSVAARLETFAVSALDASTGRLLWQAGNKGTDAIAAGGGVVFTSPEPLVARDARTGRYLWQQSGSADQPWALGLVGNTLYTSGNGNQLRALSALRGSQLWSFATPSSVAGPMAVGTGVVYVSTANSTPGMPGEPSQAPKPCQVYAIRT